MKFTVRSADPRRSRQLVVDRWAGTDDSKACPKRCREVQQPWGATIYGNTLYGVCVSWVGTGAGVCVRNACTEAVVWVAMGVLGLWYGYVTGVLKLWYGWPWVYWGCGMGTQRVF
eukprot:1184306-Prorocentrum_minimum.AAC.2